MRVLVWIVLVLGTLLSLFIVSNYGGVLYGYGLFLLPLILFYVILPIIILYHSSEKRTGNKQKQKTLLIIYLLVVVVVPLYLFVRLDLPGIRYLAVKTKNPGFCSILGGDNVFTRQPCYFEAIQEIGDVSMCEKYPVDANFCRNLIAQKTGDISMCDVEKNLNDYNYCVYNVAGGSKGPAACDYIKSGTNYSKDRCLLGIAEYNQQPSNHGVDEVNNVCNLISNSQLRDYCIGNAINYTHNPNLCSQIKDPVNLTKGTIASGVCNNHPANSITPLPNMVEIN